VLLTTHPF